MNSQTELSREQMISKAQIYFEEGYACSQSVLLAYAERFDLDLRTAKLISSTFGGGMGRLRKTCGAVTGGFMVLGMAYGNEHGSDMSTKLNAYARVRELYRKVEDIHGTVECKELLKQHATPTEIEERKHHKIFCRQMVGEIAGLLYEQLNQDINH